MLEFIFILSIALIFFAYLGYPITLLVIGFFFKKTVKQEEILPRISFIITVHNEEKRILPKLENTATLDYPASKFQVIIAADGCSDRTNEIVQEFNKANFQLLALQERRGKENAQQEAVRLASGDILFFSDVATILDRGILKEMVSNFSDPLIGCVSSKDMILSEKGDIRGEGLYVKYEMWLRRLESKINSVVGLSGSFFAARKEVCEDFSANMQSDFRTLLNSIKKGLRGISDEKAIGYYQHAINEKQEFNRKVRTVLRGQTVFFNNLEFLNIFKYGLFSFQYLCHKLLRWSVPILMIIILLTNFLLITRSVIYQISLFLQIGFYTMGVLSLLNKLPGANKLMKIPEYFIMVNYSILIAWLKLIRGERVISWRPTDRN
jgi:glycosyltransferase involved in cell wall biosynthesis